MNSFINLSILVKVFVDYISGLNGYLSVSKYYGEIRSSYILSLIVEGGFFEY